MKLNVYEKKEIIKTYTAERYDLEFGLLEDVAKTVRIDELKTGSDIEILKIALEAVTKNMNTVKDLMKDVFDGISDEELRHTRVKEIAVVMVDIVKLTIEELGKGFNTKN